MLQFKSCNFFVFIIDEIKQLICFYTNAALKSLFVCLCILMTSNLNAQTDTMVVDTISMAKIDSLTKPDNDAYADTSIKHIYDTSQYFFNWKEYSSQPYTTNKLVQRQLIDEDVKKLKNDHDFWYIPAIEKIEARLRTDAAFRDSLLKAGKNEIVANEKDFRQ